MIENLAFHTHFGWFGGVGTNENTWKWPNQQNRFRKNDENIFFKTYYRKCLFSMKIYENLAFHTHFIDFGGVGTNENTWKLQNKQNRFRKMRKKNRFYNKKSQLITIFDYFRSNLVKISQNLMKSNENKSKFDEIQWKLMRINENPIKIYYFLMILNDFRWF